MLPSPHPNETIEHPRMWQLSTTMSLQRHGTEYETKHVTRMRKAVDRNKDTLSADLLWSLSGLSLFCLSELCDVSGLSRSLSGLSLVSLVSLSLWSLSLVSLSLWSLSLPLVSLSLISLSLSH